jgi:hypothetical protein
VVVSVGQTTSLTQAPFVVVEAPVTTPKKSPRGLRDLLPLVFVPVHTPVEPVCTPMPDRSLSIGLSSEPDQRPAAVVDVVTRVLPSFKYTGVLVWPTLLIALTEDVDPIASYVTVTPL